MWCLGRGSSASSESKTIENELRLHRKTAQRQHKILLLGTGNSGKQLTAKFGGHNPHFHVTDAELIRYLRGNLLDGINKVLAVFNKKFGDAWPPHLKDKVEVVARATPDTFTTTDATNIQEILQEDEVRAFLESKGDHMSFLGGLDGFYYYTQNAKNYADPMYKPTPEDYLRNRIKTVGIVEFSYGGYDFHICDVAGQRSERKKWIHCFNNVSAVIYLLACNEYDVNMEESLESNSMFDAVRQFQIVSDLLVFENIPFIVFFNKYDLLPDKVKRSPLSGTFKDYHDWCRANPKSRNKNDAENAIDYFTDIMKRHFKGKSVEFFTTCALDVESCTNVFESVQRSVVMRKMQDTGFEMG